MDGDEKHGSGHGHGEHGGGVVTLREGTKVALPDGRTVTVTNIQVSAGGGGDALAKSEPGGGATVNIIIIGQL